MNEWTFQEKEEGFFAVNGDEEVFLGDDQDEAERVFALRNVINDWASEIVAQDYRENRFEVSPRSIKSGASPEEIEMRIALLRQALGSVKDKINQFGMDVVRDGAFLINDKWVKAEDLTLADLKQMGYKLLTYYFETDCPELLSVGTHDLRNTLHFLIDSTPITPRATNYQLSLIEAWEGKKVIDRRRTDHTNDGEYLVLTDDEADAAWDDDLETFIEECLEIPKEVEPYFDRERWKRDARMNGRGSSLNRYDGKEMSFGGYYIYRQN